MTLLRYSLRGKPQSGENGVSGGALGLPPNPVLNPGQPFGCLMDVVAIGDVDKRFEQLLEALGAGLNRRGCRVTRSTSRCPYDVPHFLDLSHPSAFPRGISTQSLSLAG
jgi:hypothetical protein